MEQPPGRTVVAVDDDGTVLGSAKMGPNRPGPRRAHRDGELHGRPGGQGRGVGRALGEHVLAWARATGYRGMQFNAVVETNTAAVRAVAGAGLRDHRHGAGGVRPPGAGLVGLHVMYRPL